jgi:hypothetical protein
MDEIIRIECPCCHNILWLDKNHRVIKHEKNRAKKEVSLQELLKQEKIKKESYDETFLSAKKLGEKKKEDASVLFNNAFTGIDDPKR